jgi:hypothetical protein
MICVPAPKSWNLNARLEEAADAPERLDILEELAEPRLEVLPRHAAAQARGIEVAHPRPELADQVV